MHAYLSKVVNLSTGAEYFYHLPPGEAVVAAYRQYTLGDWAWWTRGKPVPELEEGHQTVTCGDYCAFKRRDI